VMLRRDQRRRRRPDKEVSCPFGRGKIMLGRRVGLAQRAGRKKSIDGMAFYGLAVLVERRTIRWICALFRFVI
jgi:hypothetical protein